MKLIARFAVRAILALVGTTVMGAILLPLCADTDSAWVNAIGLMLGLVILWFCSCTKLGQAIVRLYKAAFKLG